MNIFGVGLPEMVLILAVALLVFGPKRLPEIGRTIAKTLKMLQDASKEFETELKKEADNLSAMVEDKPQPKSATASASEAKSGEPQALPEGDGERPDTTEAESTATAKADSDSTDSESTDGTEEVKEIDSSGEIATQDTVAEGEEESTEVPEPGIEAEASEPPNETESLPAEEQEHSKSEESPIETEVS